MTKPVSLYLDLVRFSAALAVFTAHLGSYPFSKDVIWWRLSAYGTIAVTIFFVLSGYVIAHVASTREGNAANYFIARTARLYSVLLLALVLTFIFDKIGTTIDPALYSIPKVLTKPESWQGYLSTFFFVNEFQIFHFDGISAGTNGPLWSLSFEATYYLVAGLVLFTSRRVWLPASVIILLLAGRTITALLPVWALGYFIYNRNFGANLPKIVLAVGALLTIFLIALMPNLLRFLPSDNYGIYMPWGRKPFDRNLTQDYLVAVLFAINIICVQNLFGIKANVPFSVERTIRWASTLTFPLYCMHYPALCVLTALSPWPASSVANAVFVSAVTMCLIVAVTPICDRLKFALRSLMRLVNVKFATTSVAG